MLHHEARLSGRTRGGVRHSATVHHVPELTPRCCSTVLHQPLIETDDVKGRLAGQGATTILNRTAQADIVRAFALCRVVR